MNLKNAAAVGLIALIAASLVLLIARALDLQTASRLETHLERIVDELEAIRRQSDGAAGGSSLPSAEPDDALVVYYFHSNTRCPTCLAIESQAHAAVVSHFAEELTQGTVAWKVLNYEERSSAALVKQFAIQVPMVVLARRQKGAIRQWKRLDDVWTLVDDKPAFDAYVYRELAALLDQPARGVPDNRPGESSQPAPAADPVPELPVP